MTPSDEALLAGMTAEDWRKLAAIERRAASKIYERAGRPIERTPDYYSYREATDRARAFDKIADEVEGVPASPSRAQASPGAGSRLRPSGVARLTQEGE